MRTKARTWTAWLLLAVFIPLAGTTAWLWRGQVKRQNDQAFTAQAASIGASVTTAVRRMDDLTLAARALLGSHPEMTDSAFNRWYRSMGVDERFAGVAGFSYVDLVRERRKGVYPAGDRPYYCLPKLGVERLQLTLQRHVLHLELREPVAQVRRGHGRDRSAG